MEGRKAADQTVLDNVKKVESIYRKRLEDYYKISTVIGEDTKELILMKKIFAIAERCRKELEHLIDRVDEHLKTL